MSTAGAGSLLDVDGLGVAAGDRLVLDGVSLRLAAGGRVGVVGESGAGKSTLGLAALGVLRTGLRQVGGRVLLAGRDLAVLPERERRRTRRGRIAWLAQDPASALTPTLRVGAQVAELSGGPRAAGNPGAEVRARLAAVGLPSDADFLRRLPRQLSGGQQQRLALARVLACDPDLLVLDEPTSRLDPVSRDVVAGEVDRLQRRLGFALLLISHDLPLVARLVDDVVVLRAGRTVEAGAAREVLRGSREPYTRALVAAVPDLRRAPTRPAAPTGPPVLEAVDLAAAHGRSTVLQGVSFAVAGGSCLGVLGASGAGKTTLARVLAGLRPPAAGEVRLDARPLPAAVADRTVAQRRAVQLVPQDVDGSLNPRRRVLPTVARPLRRLHGLSRAAAAVEAQRLLSRVGLAVGTGARLPHELSGGERQRVAIARALAARPRVLICDEITSALDATVQAGLLELLEDLRDRGRLALVVIAHDLGVVRRVADQVTVLDRGRCTEAGRTADVLDHPASAAARALVEAAPSLTALLDADPAARAAAAPVHTSSGSDT